MKDIRLAIVYREYGFPGRWVEYCQKQHISYKTVNPCDSDIISQLRDFDGLLCHFHHTCPEHMLIARHILRAAEQMGLKVYPNTATMWSFDDKVAQKYQLEAIGAPLIPTYSFFDEKKALDWIEQTEMPKVFKLRRGAGSLNVSLVRTHKQGKALIKKAFSSGFKPMGTVIGDQVSKKLLSHTTIRQKLRNLNKIAKLPSLLRSIYNSNKRLGRERGYVYFQDFVPDNTCDTRITAIGDHHIFGFFRDVRDNDFRASGSGKIRYDCEQINPKCIEISIDVAKKLKTQSIVLDFIEDKQHRPWLTEISYGFVPEAVYACPGYWDLRLQWHYGHIWPQDLIIEDLLGAIRQETGLGG